MWRNSYVNKAYWKGVARMNFKYYDMEDCSLEFEAENLEDKKLLQSIYLKLIRNKTEVFEHLKELQE